MSQKTINWNQASERGLIARINTEILHPLGLAMIRNPENGVSPGLIVADGAEPFAYAQGYEASGEELFTFLMIAGTSDALGEWVSFTTDAMTGPDPETPEEARALFAELLRRAKSDGVYPLK